MTFDCRKFLGEEMFRQVNEIQTFDPEIVISEAMRRRKPDKKKRVLVLAAADHNARMINEYKGNPIGLSNRRDYLSRLVRILTSDKVDGLEAAPDIIEEVLIINYLRKKEGYPDFLDGKMMIGTVNRGGLRDSAWEMDDMCTCFTVERLVKLRMDGAKFMIRINPRETESRHTLRYCAETVNAAEKQGLPVFIEALFVETDENGHFVVKTDTESLCKVVGVVSALGCTSTQKWIELPRNPDYPAPAGAAACSVLVVPDESETETSSIIREYTKEKGIHPNVRGILLGRNVMFHDSDPFPLADAIGGAWHSKE